MSIDLEQFHQVFFEESLEGLDVMEQSLLEIDPATEIDSETINAIFRAAHSIKGGSGTFGFDAITHFTHVLETLLDEVRDGKRQITNDMVELLLKSCDCLRNMIVALQNGDSVDQTEAQPLIQAFEAILNGGSAPIPTAESTTAAAPTSNGGDHGDILAASIDTMLNGNDSPASAAEPETGITLARKWTIDFIPQPQILLTGNEPLRIFRELESLGNLTSSADISQVPTLRNLIADECFIKWTLTLEGDVTKDDILDVFDWVLDECKLEITEPGESTAPASEEPAAAAPAATEPATGTAPEPAPTPTAPEATEAAADKADSNANKSAAATASSIRVGIDKVDSLINLVGELVITQSMLSELGNNFEMNKVERLSNGLEQLLQNTKELQESVMRIRMLPISVTFNRFPRMIRDLSAKIGKKVELKLSGEQTELDKTVMEQISDPLVHLVRNAIDHGIEPAQERIDSGKDETGTIHLNAYHKGGNIIIEISDDGRGLNPEKILTKAKEKGVVDGNEQLSDEQIYELIFEPGFSTAEVVSDISGRGVGMDVVRRNIKELGGRISVESELGKGSIFKVQLPLTLAILDGQLVRVGKEIYIIPLITIVESLQIKPELVNKVSGNMVVYRLREDNVPIIPLYKEFNIEADNTELENALLVVVEDSGQKVGLLVDDLLAQQQVVIKSLESNYQRIEGISGATILGDGSVSLILDIPGLIDHVSRQGQNNPKSRAA